MNVFNKLVAICEERLTETLHWDGREGFMLVAEFPSMGHRTETEKSLEEARKLICDWTNRPGAEVLYSDQRQLNILMEGTEWPGGLLSTLQSTPLTSDELTLETCNQSLANSTRA